MTLIKIIIIMSIFSMCWWRKVIIMMLMSLEILLISLFSLLSLMNYSTSSMALLIMLSLMVSGSSLGLSLLVSISRSHKSSSTTPIWILTFDKIIISTTSNYPIH